MDELVLAALWVIELAAAGVIVWATLDWRADRRARGYRRQRRRQR